MTTTVREGAPLSEKVLEATFGRNTFRWCVIIVATLVAFGTTWLQLVEEIRRGTTGGYVLLVPPLAAIVAIAVTHRRHGELPIHDRQTDTIVSLLLMAVSLAAKYMLVPRYATTYQVMHLDVLAAWIFVCGACVAMFGLRATSAYWTAWMMLFLTSPLVYRAALIELGGSKHAAGIVTLVIAASAIGLAMRTSRKRGFVYGTATFVLGLVILNVLNMRWPDAPIGLSQYVPAGSAAVVVGISAYLLTYRGFAPRYLPPNPVGPAKAARATLWVLPTALVLALIPLPDQQLTPISPGPPFDGTATQVIPSGWYQFDSVDYDWPRAYFGRSAILRRQMIRAQEPNPDWDVLMRPRTIAVQTLQVRRAGSFEVYPTQSMYDLGKARVSPKEYVDLGYGVTAEYFTVLDDDLLLTWNMLSFIWTRGDTVAQRVSLLTVDNHEPDAPFPQPSPNTTANLRQIVQVFLRGNATVEDTDPEYKDRDMLAEVGRQLVEAQWGGL